MKSIISISVYFVVMAWATASEMSVVLFDSKTDETIDIVQKISRDGETFVVRSKGKAVVGHTENEVTLTAEADVSVFSVKDEVEVFHESITNTNKYVVREQGLSEISLGGTTRKKSGPWVISMKNLVGQMKNAKLFTVQSWLAVGFDTPVDLQASIAKNEDQQPGKVIVEDNEGRPFILMDLKNFEILTQRS